MQDTKGLHIEVNKHWKWLETNGRLAVFSLDKVMLSLCLVVWLGWRSDVFLLNSKVKHSVNLIFWQAWAVLYLESIKKSTKFWTYVQIVGRKGIIFQPCLDKNFWGMYARYGWSYLYKSMVNSKYIYGWDVLTWKLFFVIWSHPQWEPWFKDLPDNMNFTPNTFYGHEPRMWVNIFLFDDPIPSQIIA